MREESALTTPDVIDVVVRNPDTVGILSPSVRAAGKREGGGDDESGEAHFE